MAVLQRGDVGTLIAVDMQVPMVGATSISFKIEKPSGAFDSWTATINGDLLEYTVIAGDLNEIGIYRGSPKFVLGGFDGSGEGFTFEVVDKYAEQ